MNLYRQSIAFFGIALPLVAAFAVVGLCYHLKTRVVRSYENKMTNYKTYEMGRLAGLEIEGQVTRQRSHIDRWTKQLAEETASTLTTQLREITETLPNKEIQQTAFEPTKAKAGFGAVSAQNSSQIRIAFRGTFRTMQKAFLELETRMPQLQLQELRIEPNATQSSLLNFQVSYTAWEN
ncbi:hypothetical protein JIN84_06680 [Luteolibacter yonseiensis]|uniref:Uncharacterized protein n=1 Tax=Luteolibacter yonseiensis TaxID=1144680 RepID=A0A934R4U7_9BACT|nr:hypothetical protein [Luteolibacter yonseiensis]MBK1815290.1 hypothetical protein [Luteolibacter yonseiensis]